MVSEAPVTRAAFTAAELVDITGGRLTAEVPVSGVSTDSRSVRPGELYVALSGERFDGHDFVSAAVAGGAALALVSRPADAAVPQLVVPDTLAALHALAAAHRARFDIPVVGLTGSNGKTTTKEMIAAVLAPLGPVHRTPGNLNNHIGVPLTLLGLSGEHRAAVVEMGMNHAGEIRVLAALARPGVAVITNAGRAHLEGLGGREAVADAKSEIAERLGHEDTLIYFGDDALLRDKNARRSCRRRTFGFGPSVDCNATDIAGLGFNGVEFTASGFGRVRIGLPGRHNVLNALAALAVADVLGVDHAAAVAGLLRVRPAPGRMQVKPAGDITVIDDSYNANPDSMRAALDLLRETEAGRRIAVLGEMLELGRASESLHREIGAAAAFVDRLFAIGPSASLLAEAAVNAGLPPERIHVARDIAALESALVPVLTAGDVVLIKGSRGMALERLLPALESRSSAERKGG